MWNLDLPETLTAGDTGYVGHRNAVHAWANEASVDTGWRNVPLRNGFTLESGGFLRIRKVLNFITVISMSGIDGSSATSAVMMEFNSNPATGVDAGYRGSDPLRSPRFVISSTDTMELRIAAAQLLNVGRKSVPASQTHEWMFFSGRGRVRVPGEPV